MRFPRTLITLGVAAPVTPEEEQALQDAAERRTSAMSDRQFVAEAIVAAALAIVATIMALSDHSGLDVPVALALVLTLALIQRADFEVGSAYTVPTQLVFVPMLFLLPAGTIPSAVAMAMVIDRIPDVSRGRLHPERVINCVSDAWFAVGPALVFLIAKPGPPDLGDWPIYVAALAAQFSFDGFASAIRASGGLRLPTADLVREMRVIWLVDVLLAPVGLMAAIAATRTGRFAFALVVPLALLLRLFAAERRARLAQTLELSDTYRRVAILLGDVIGDDDEYTGAHSKGVVALSVAVADELGVSVHDRYLVEFGALLHDVGKIAMPKAIINKPGKLDADEWEIMKTHTIEGQRMLDKVGGSLHGVGLVVRASHEAWNGAGYPDGLAGEEIPLAARIVSCADAFSAMTTDRSYRAAMSADVAIAELQRCAGTQFDPAVANATIVVASRSEAEVQALVAQTDVDGALAAAAEVKSASV